MCMKILIFRQKRIPLRIFSAYEKGSQVGFDYYSHPNYTLFGAGFAALSTTCAKLGGR